MKSTLQHALHATLALVLLACTWQIAANALRLPAHLVNTCIGCLALATLFALLLRRVRCEDRDTRLEAARCRAQNARSQAEQALIEADRLLERLTGSGAGGARSASRMPDLQASLMQIQAELALLQQNAALDSGSATRLARARDRVELVARGLRNAARSAEPG